MEHEERKRENIKACRVALNLQPIFSLGAIETLATSGAALCSFINRMVKLCPC
jgi:hypothetical protein